MQKDAEIHAEEDKKKKDAVDIKNTTEMILYTAEKALKDSEGKVSDEIKNGVQSKIDALKAVKDGDDMEQIKKATEELSSEMSKIGEAMQKANAEATPNTEAESEPKTEEPIRDAETGESEAK